MYERILALFQQKLNALDTDPHAADEADSEEEEIAENLFEAVQKMAKVKSEDREDPYGGFDDGFLWGESHKNRRNDHAWETLEGVGRFPRNSLEKMTQKYRDLRKNSVGSSDTAQ